MSRVQAPENTIQSICIVKVRISCKLPPRKQSLQENVLQDVAHPDVAAPIVYIVNYGFSYMLKTNRIHQGLDQKQCNGLVFTQKMALQKNLKVSQRQ